jgi:hypothetical protein
MSLKGDKQKNIQFELDFSSAPTGETREAGREETESSVVTSGTERPKSWPGMLTTRANITMDAASN